MVSAELGQKTSVLARENSFVFPIKWGSLTACCAVSLKHQSPSVAARTFEVSGKLNDFQRLF